MDFERAFQVVTGYLAERFEIPREKITVSAHLFKDLKLDSIDALDMIAIMENDYNLKVVEEDLMKLRTVRDVVEYAVRYMPAHA